MLSAAYQTLQLPSAAGPAPFDSSGVALAPLWALAAAAGIALLGSLGLPRGRSAGERAEAGDPAGSLPASMLWGALALLGVPAAMAVVAAQSLETAGMALAALTVLDLLPSVRGRRAALAWAVGLGSTALWWWAVQLRLQAGGEGTVEWLGTPFSGDTPTTLAFLSLAVPLALPGFAGGVWAGLSSGSLRNGAGRLGFALTATLRPLAYATLCAKTFGGSEALISLGLGLVCLAPLVGLYQRCADERLSTLAYAGLWALLGAQGAATMRSVDAFALGLVGWVLPTLMLALALAFVRAEERAEPGLAPLGLARLFPLTYWASLLAAAALAGAPFLATFHGRARSAGALERHGSGEEALGYALASASLFALVAMPWVRYVFFRAQPNDAQAPPRRRQREPLLLLVALGLGAAATLAIGIAPDLLQGLLPYGDLAASAFPTQLGQLQLLLGGVVVASFFKRRTDRPDRKLSSTP